MKKCMVLLFIIPLCSACSTLVGESMFTGEDEGRLLLDTDRAGLEAWFQGLNGLVTTGKAKPNINDSYWTTQESAIKARSFRVIKGGKSYTLGGTQNEH